MKYEDCDIHLPWTSFIGMDLCSSQEGVLLLVTYVLVPKFLLVLLIMWSKVLFMVVPIAACYIPDLVVWQSYIIFLVLSSKDSNS